MPDATIIGAGPAGSAAAIILARAGWVVTLLEQHRFPRPKVCGECLSTVGIDVVSRLGLKDTLERHGAVPLTHAAIHSLDGRSVRFPLPSPMAGLSREVLDTLLLDAARTAGAKVRQPVRCESLAPGPSVHVRDLIENMTEVLRPTHVIVADGKGSLLPSRPEPTRDLGIKAHFQYVAGPRDTIELFGCRGFYGGLAAIGGDRWNVAWSIPADTLRAGAGDIDAVFNEIRLTHPVLRQRLDGATRVSPWIASPLPRFGVRAAWPPGVIPIGNAAAAIEPIGGEGMGLALASAESAALSLVEGRYLATIGHRYRALWSRRRWACRAAALVVSRPRLLRAVFPPLQYFPPVKQAALNAIGKFAHGQNEITAEPACR